MTVARLKKWLSAIALAAVAWVMLVAGIIGYRWSDRIVSVASPVPVVATSQPPTQPSPPPPSPLPAPIPTVEPAPIPIEQEVYSLSDEEADRRFAESLLRQQ